LLKLDILIELFMLLDDFYGSTQKSYIKFL